VTKVGVIVNFSIENDPKGSVFVGERLVTTLEINNAKAAHGETGGIGYQSPGIVGTAMFDLVIHLKQGGTIGALAVSPVKDAADAAHT